MKTALNIKWIGHQLVWLAVLSLCSNLAAGSLSLLETEKTIEIRDGERTMLVYNKAPVPPPEGKDPAYARSGFIHPLKSPSGGVVTSIHADDHIPRYAAALHKYPPPAAPRGYPDHKFDSR